VANQPHIFGSQFVETMPNAQLQWIEECGHVPHLEQPDETADAIASFLSTEVAAATVPMAPATSNRLI
jgi:pimeloyl-ACP methyl ester carboxylesterase